MFYLGAIAGLPVGFLLSIAFPGVVAYLRAGYFAKVHSLYQLGQKEVSQVEKKL